MTETDQNLLMRYAADRDAEAFRSLVSRHAGMVFGVCHRVLRNVADAEDAAQNCFLKLSSHAGRLRPPIGGWLHRTAMRAALEIVRKDRSRRLRERASVDLRRHTPPAWEEIKEVVDREIAALPGDLRAAVVLHYLEGRTQEDVAAELGIQQPAVSKRLSRAVEELRARLGKAGWLGSAALLGGLLTANGAEAAPATLTASLGKMALAGAAAGRAAATGVTAKAAAAVALLGGVLAAIVITRLGTDRSVPGPVVPSPLARPADAAAAPQIESLPRVTAVAAAPQVQGPAQTPVVEVTTLQGVVSVEKTEGVVTEVGITVKTTVEGKETTKGYRVVLDEKGKALAELAGKTVVAKGVLSAQETKRGKLIWITLQSAEEVKK